MENKIWLSSDFHLGHNKEFLYRPRNFESIEEHDNKIIENWNSIVSKEDECYILGDLILNNNEAGIEKLSRMNGRWHIVLGNHDTDTRIQLYSQLPHVIEVVYATVFKYKGYHFYCSHYPTITSNLDIDKPLKNRVISLCGHSHYKNRFEDMDKGLIYHCELDSHNNYPILIDDIIEDIKNKVKENEEIL